MKPYETRFTTSFNFHCFLCNIKRRYIKKFILCLTTIVFFFYLLTSKRIPDGYFEKPRFPSWEPVMSFNSKPNNRKMQDCMTKKSSKNSLESHPEAPINSLLAFDPIVAVNTSICEVTRKSLRILVVLTKPWKEDIRNAIRNTYANFSSSDKGQSSWTRIFIVGSPRSETEKRNLQIENFIFNDLVVANISDQYSLITLKVLAAMKFVSCLCPNAEYFVKADDDTYINISELDREITKTERLFEQRRKTSLRTQQTRQHNIARKPKPGIYLGHSAGKQAPVVRAPPGDKYAVSRSDYSENFYPEYMIGFFYVLSMSLVQKLATDCPYHCISLSTSKTNLTKPCFWKFEDIFIGSCISHSQLDAFWAGKPSSIPKNNWEDISKLVTQWVDAGTKPVHVHKIKSTQEFHLLHQIITFLKDEYPHNEAVENLLQKYAHQ